ncbi:MAG TPA: hypothetical protein VLG37_03820 [Candidatus Saccharimonadales bacterium]|nr:hypothetical protein [Candidatus Saccharimonadales bacterium]
MTDKNKQTSALVDNILRIAVGGSALAAGIVIPNLLVALDKPLQHFFKTLDERERVREMRRVINYMKSQNLIRGDYQHGLTITDKGKARLTDQEFNKLTVKTPEKWDGWWRLVIYDIPEKHKSGRNALTAKLRDLGFYQLQRSAWIHPLPCRDVVEIVTQRFDINSYVSYIETPFIDNQQKLISAFAKRLSSSLF